jgi:hypothetical protein
MYCKEHKLNKDHKINISIDKKHLFSLKDWDVYNSVKRFVLNIDVKQKRC